MLQYNLGELFFYSVLPTRLESFALVLLSNFVKVCLRASMHVLTTLFHGLR